MARNICLASLVWAVWASGALAQEPSVRFVTNWKTQSVQISADLANASPSWQVKVPVGGTVIPVEIGPKGVVLTARPNELRAALTPGTRSLWLEDKSGRRRLDLPPVAFRSITVKDDQGPHLVMTVDNLLPGFRLYCARQGELQNEPAFLVTRRAGADFQIVDIAADTESTRVTLRLPSLEGQEKAAYHLMIVGLDGSRSQTASVSRAGDVIDQKIASVTPVRPAPVDELIAVPTVELMPAGKANDEVRKAGLVPVFLDLRTMEEVSAAKVDPETLVLRQGAAPRSELHRGDTLLLSIRESRGIPLDLSKLPPVDLGAIDAGDRLGFVATPADGLLGLQGHLVRAGKAPKGQALPAASHDGSSSERSVALAVSADPGICLDPTRTPERLVRSALLKVVLDAVDAGQAKSMPGPLAKALNTSLQLHEKDVRNAIVVARLPAEKIPVDGILDLVTLSLEIKLPAQEHRRLVKGWQDYARPRLHPALLDRNRSLTISDDVVVWFLGELEQRELYEPARDVRLTLSPTGVPLALLGETKNPVDWIKKEKLTLNLGNLSGLLPQLKPAPKVDKKDPPGKNTEDKIIITDGEVKIRIPKGPNRVVGSSGPDQVRIPSLKDEKAGDALDKLKELGLQTKSKSAKLFALDKIVGTDPPEKKWVEPGSMVTLDVQHRVPKLVGKKFADADKDLDAREFNPQSPIANFKFLPADKITFQDPPEGKYLRPGGKVTLKVERAVPLVTGKNVADANAILANHGFEGDYFKPTAPKDVILAQQPKAGEAAEVGAKIELTLRRTIPQVEGKSYRDAQVLLKQHQLGVKNPQDFDKLDGIKLDALFVADQVPAADKIFRVGPDTDPMILKVVLTPGVKVPVLKEKALATALNLLKETLLRPDYKKTPGSEIPLKVVETAPEAEKVVPLNTPIKLTVAPIGVPVPALKFLTLGRAEDLLKKLGLKPAVKGKGLDTDLVLEQVPPPDTPAKRSFIGEGGTVTLHPGVPVPVLKTLTRDAAVNKLRQLGLEPGLPKTFTHGTDKVISQDPPAHTSSKPVVLPHGFKVNLTLTAVVPALEGKLLSDALKELQDRKIDPDKLETNFPQAKVFDQKPDAGFDISRGQGKVRLGLKVPVPALEGKGINVAVGELKARGLEDDVVPKAFPSDIVFDQKPEKGTYLAPGQTVLVFPGFAVPSLKGKFEDADLLLKKMGIPWKPKGSTQERITENSSLDGKVLVLGQTPDAGKVQARGSTVLLELARYKFVAPGLLVPDFVKGRTVERAKELAGTKLNLRFSIVMKNTADPSLDGKEFVTDQSEPAGKRVNEGTQIVLQVTRWRGMGAVKMEPLVTYGSQILVGGELPITVGKCTVSADRKTLDVVIFRGKGFQNYRGTLVPQDNTRVAGKVCLTYNLSNEYSLRIPEDGEGQGQLRFGRGWIGDEKNRLMFSKNPGR